MEVWVLWVENLFDIMVQNWVQCMYETEVLRDLHHVWVILEQ
jgi:hypothetical protein